MQICVCQKYKCGIVQSQLFNFSNSAMEHIYSRYCYCCFTAFNSDASTAIAEWNVESLNQKNLTSPFALVLALFFSLSYSQNFFATFSRSFFFHFFLYLYLKLNSITADNSRRFRILKMNIWMFGRKICEIRT